MKTLLFVCTGNTCRSSMAAALAWDIWAKKGGMPDELRIISAGIAAFPGAQASREAVEVLRAEGIDLRSHQAQQLTPAMIKEADLILTMSAGHKQRVLDMVPEAKDKAFLLMEYAAGLEGTPQLAGLDVSDPFGWPLDIYRVCACQLRAAIEQVVDRMRNFNHNS